MPLKLTNNATSVLAGAILSTDVALSVSGGDGAKFPSLSAGDWFPATIVNASGGYEIVRVTARAGDLFTVARGQEGTAALNFVAGDRVDLRLTAAAIAEFAQLSDIPDALLVANNLSDLENVEDARTNLGLGDSATKNVGTDVNTVAAGDDSRITGAMQKNQNLNDVGDKPTARTNLNVPPNTRTISAGLGLSGGGSFAADRTISMQTPGALSPNSVDQVTANGHTHSISGFHEVYTGAGVNETDFPIGHVIAYIATVEPNRNAVVTPALSTAFTTSYTDTASVNAGDALLGTWRARGGLDAGGEPRIFLAERVA